MSPIDNSNNSNYREWLVRANHEASQSYDRTLLTLAGGALGLSFAFIRELVPHPLEGTIPLLLSSWGAFGTSLLGTLFSLLTSQYALRHAMWQYDNDRLDKEYPGGKWAIATKALSLGAGLIFVLGVALLVWFAGANLL